MGTDWRHRTKKGVYPFRGSGSRLQESTDDSHCIGSRLNDARSVFRRDSPDSYQRTARERPRLAYPFKPDDRIGIPLGRRCKDGSDGDVVHTR